MYYKNAFQFIHYSLKVGEKIKMTGTTLIYFWIKFYDR